jgi:hypothetical protein
MNDQRLIRACGENADETEGEKEGDESMEFHGGKRAKYGSPRSESTIDAGSTRNRASAALRSRSTCGCDDSGAL